MMHSHPHGAHEVIELHEVLNCTVDALNTIQLYAPHVVDQELAQLVHHQTTFMQNEYNSMVHTVQGVGAGESLPYRPTRHMHVVHSSMPNPVASPMQQQPNFHPAQVDDADVASALLGIHKSGAKAKLHASLEATHPQIREMLLQGAVNCTHQAYEVWQYMQRKGYYPLAVLPHATSSQLLRAYQPLHQGMPQALPNHVQTANFAMAAGGVSAQLARGMTEPYAVPQPMVEPTPVNASQIFSSPAYRDQHSQQPIENTEMITEELQTSGVEPMGVLSQHMEEKTARGRKKTPSTDMNLGH